MSQLPILIQTEEAAQSAFAVLEQAPALAVDTETDAFFAYRPRICLIQVSVPGHDYIFDPMAEIDLSGLGALIGEASRETVFHAAENDVILLQHQFGWRVGRLFDTQVACFVLGEKPYGLAGILEARFGVKLDKSQQRSDWSRRPLDPRQIEYASEDTCHLLALAADLGKHAEEQGRTEEISSECRRIAERTWEPEPFDPEGFHRMAGARDLEGVGLRILRDLFLFRHAEAERRNWAPFRIAPDGVLVAIARERIREGRRPVPESFWRRYGKRIAPLVAKAIERGPLTDRPRRRERGAPVPPEVKARYEGLRRWRTGAAEKRGVESFVVARNELLQQLAAANARTLDGLEALLEPWRLREYGAAMLDAMHSKGDNQASEE